MIDGIAFQRGAAGAKVVEHYFIVELYLSSNLGTIFVYLPSIDMLQSALLFECSHWCERLRGVLNTLLCQYSTAVIFATN